MLPGLAAIAYFAPTCSRRNPFRRSSPSACLLLARFIPVRHCFARSADLEVRFGGWSSFRCTLVLQCLRIVFEDVVFEDFVFEDVAFEDFVSEDFVSEDVVFEDIVFEDVVSEDFVFEDVVFEDFVSEDFVLAVLLPIGIGKVEK